MLGWAGLFMTIPLFAVVILNRETRDILWWGSGRSPWTPSETIFHWGISAVAMVLSLPFLARDLSQASGNLDRRFGQLAYPLFLFHWIPRRRLLPLGGLAESGVVERGPLRRECGACLAGRIDHLAVG